MKQVGIEKINVYAGTTFLDVGKLAEHRKLDTTRFENLLMRQKTVALPYEDPITFAVNAAKPLIDSLTEEEINRIEMVITCTESSFDFGKSMSTYCHDLLGLNRNCRLFELKNACYSGVAGFQMAVNFVLSQCSPGAKALVIATDISRFIVEEGGNALTEDWSFAEPSGGSGAVALLVSDSPSVFQVDVGANGYYGYEVMDTCRPSADGDAGDSDLSLLSYLDCCENAFLEYKKRVENADYASSFSYLAFHCPFGGMVKGAHRNMMRKIVKAKPQEIEIDFERRVIPGINYCARIGNIMGATALLSLVSTIVHGDFQEAKRIGIFSYGSGCCSEFFSGVVNKSGQDIVRNMQIGNHLDRRYELTMPEYDELLAGSKAIKFGTRNVSFENEFLPLSKKVLPTPTLFLNRINEFHREYEWIS